MVKAASSTTAEAKAAIIEKKRKDAAYVLSNPVFLEVSEPIRKIRSNLLIISVISIFAILMGLEITPTLTIAGVELTGLTEYKISAGLAIVTAYMLIHFVWCSWDGFQEWRIRCSGVNIAFTDTPPPKADPRQLSLMSWWTAQVSHVARLQDETEQAYAQFEKTIATFEQEPPDTKALHAMKENFHRYSSGMMQLYKTGVSTANEKSLREQLERFDLFYKSFHVSQNLRWILFEVGVPVLLALIAFFLLLSDLNLNPFLDRLR